MIAKVNLFTFVQKSWNLQQNVQFTAVGGWWKGRGINSTVRKILEDLFVTNHF